jgi:heme A synthase
MTRFARFAWGVLAYNLLVIAWGAFVRASGSGAGCGRHWPLCNGEIVPRAQRIETIVEATHRATSGIALVLVVVLAVWAWRALPAGHPGRRASVMSAVFVSGEALIGAGLVLFELVAHDASMKRALSMVLHLCNTFFLLGSLAVTAWTASVPRRERSDSGYFARMMTRGALAAVMLLAASGAIAALGDTLFPARSLGEGLAQDLSPMAHAFIRLRLLHPLIAIMTALLVMASAGIARMTHRSPTVAILSRVVTIVFAAQIGAGLLNIALLAPVWMQLLHLLLADAAWISLVLLSYESHRQAVSFASTHAASNAA